MCRRRFFKSYFYINYNEESHGVLINYGGPAHGETFSVSPFVAGGGSDTIELVSARPWTILRGDGMDWLNVECNETSVIDARKNSGTYQITLSAEGNSGYSERSGSLTAKTLNERFSVVISVMQNGASERYIYITPATASIGSVGTTALTCYLFENGTTTNITNNVNTVWSSNKTTAATVSNGTVQGCNETASAQSVTITAVYDGLSATSTVNVAAATIEKYITVNPQSANIGATGTQQLTVTYHEVINGHETTTNVTSSATIGYSSNNSAITVNGTGLVTANNQGGDTETATISITYPGTTGTTATITSSSAVIVETVELSPNNASIAYGSGQTLTVYYVKTVNGVETERRQITTPSQLPFTLSDTTAARMDGMNLVNQNVSNENKPETVYVVYNGITSNTINATMVKPASLTYRLDVTADDNNIKYNGTTQLRANYVTVVNGTDYSSVVVSPSSVSWSENSSYASVSNSGVFTASNDSSGNTRTVPVTGTCSGATGTTTINIAKKPGLDVATPSEWHLTSGAGSCTYTVTWVNLKSGSTITFNDGNLDSYSPTAITITSSNSAGGSQTITADYSENNDGDPRKLYLYATGTGLYGENLTDNDYYEQAGHNPTVEYELVVSPDSATLGYGDTTGLTVIYYVITDGVRDSGTNVTSAVTYSPNNSAATVSNSGIITGNNTGTTNATTRITISYPDGLADDVEAVITSNPATRTGELVVTATPTAITAVGTAQMSAIYYVWIGSTFVSSGDVAANQVTWEVVSGSSYATVSNTSSTAGKVTGKNQTSSSRQVTVRGTHSGVSDTDVISVAAAVTTYGDIYFSSGGGNNEINELDLSATESVDEIYAYEQVYVNGVPNGIINDTYSSSATYRIKSGNTVLSSFTCSNNGVKYSDDNITIRYNSSYSIQIESTNSQEVAKYYTLTVTDDGDTASLDISIAAASHVAVITYELEVTPALTTTQPYSASQQFIATLYRLSDGVRDGWSGDVTNNVDWDIHTTGGTFVTSEIDVGGSADWVNLNSSTGRVNVSAYLDEPEYGSPSDDVTFTVAGVSITAYITFTPSAATIASGATQQYSIDVYILHNGNQVFHDNFHRPDANSDVNLVSSDSGKCMVIENDEVQNVNTTLSSVTVTLTATFSEESAVFLPPGTIVTGTTDAVCEAGGVPLTTVLELSAVTSPVSSAATSGTIELTRENINGTVTVWVTSSNAWFDSNHTYTSTAITSSISPLQITIYFNTNGSSRDKEMVFEASGTDIYNVVKSGTCTVTQEGQGVIPPPSDSGVLITTHTELIIDNTDSSYSRKIGAAHVELYTGETISASDASPIGTLEYGPLISVPAYSMYDELNIGFPIDDVEMPVYLFAGDFEVTFIRDSASKFPDNVTVTFETGTGTQTITLGVTGIADDSVTYGHSIGGKIGLGRFTGIGERYYGITEIVTSNTVKGIIMTVTGNREII